MSNADDDVRPLGASPAPAHDARPGRGHSDRRERFRTEALPHFTPAERAARGKAARRELPRSAHAGWEPAPRRARSRRSPRGAGGDPFAGAQPDPVRAHARVAVHLLPRRRLLMAADLADGPRTGFTHNSAGTRISPTSASSPRRSKARLQHQRLRRDPSRPVRVGPEASCRELRGRRPGPRLQGGSSAARS